MVVEAGQEPVRLGRRKPGYVGFLRDHARREGGSQESIFGCVRKDALRIAPSAARLRCALAVVFRCPAKSIHGLPILGRAKIAVRWFHEMGRGGR